MVVIDAMEKGGAKRAVREACEDHEVDSGFGADYIAGNHIFERKRWDELPERMMNNENSLYMQLMKLQNAADTLDLEPGLILEGPIPEDGYEHTRIGTDSILKYLTGVYKMGITVVPSLNREHTAAFLSKLDEKGPGSSAHDTGAVRDPDKVPVSERPRYIVEGFDGVGPSTARSLLEHFGTAEAVLTASEDELQEVDGIGPATASSIRGSVTQEYEA